jgi:hypothetical protein
LSQVENELKAMKEEVAVAKKEARKNLGAAKEEEANKLKETTKDMVARWWKDGS